MLHEKLWSANLDLAASCLRHPFVVALRRGTLEAALFSGYVAQDAFFLRTFLKAYALALARTNDAAAECEFHALMGGPLEELELHRAYAAELGINLEHVIPNRACEAYTDFLLHTAWHTSPSETLAAMTPCMHLYAYLGAELAPALSDSHPYRRWIATYSSREFSELASRVEGLLDRLATDTPAVRHCYRYAMQCELDFFSEVMEKPR